MTKFRVLTQPSAEANLKEAFSWIAQRAPLNAARWFHGIRAAISSLDSMPERCSVAPESPALGYEIRQLIFGNYRILFTIRGNAVHVLHVRHGARRELGPGDIVLPETP